MNRIYENIIYNNLRKYSQMAFLVGARQVGKTTIAKRLQSRFQKSLYLNYDSVKDRQLILSGQSFIEDIFPTNVLMGSKPLIIFDEIHKYKDWKNYVKGFYDLYKDYYSIIVTGSARLDIYQLGGDSLMGRYFQYNIHPLTVSELLSADNVNFLKNPNELSQKDIDTLYKYGGFPDPYNNATDQYYNLWQSTRFKQLIHDEIRSLANLQEIYLLETLAEILKSRSGQLLNSSDLAKKISVTSQTVSRWINILDRFYYCFTVRPWFKNVTRSLIKEPKIYLLDWSLVTDEGQKLENFIASHLLKFVNFYSDTGLGKFELFYLRDIDKKEVDFLIVRDNKPFMMVEAKLSDVRMSKSIEHFRALINPDYSIQAVFNESFVAKTCFINDKPLVVPAKTFLSQLV
ncbi:MAG: ATP-binding protein [Firmicutes bacterium]|nr:ATP-binding protein [Bacillota bacterium]